MDIQQGNVVTQDMLARLEPGMDKRKVTYIMGTPLIVDPFHADEWVYLYSFQKGGGERQQREVKLYFANQRLDHVAGDVRPAKGENLPAAASANVNVEVPLGERAEDGGFFSRLMRRFRGEEPAAPSTPEETAKAAPPASGPDAAEPPAGAGSAEDGAPEEGLLHRLRRGLGLTGGIGETRQPAPEGAPSEAEEAGLEETTPEEAAVQASEAEEGPSLLERLKRGLGLGGDAGAEPAPGSGTAPDAEPEPEAEPGPAAGGAVE